MKDRSKLIEENTGLVHACARRFMGRGAEYDDLYSCGCVGLVKAADNFDESLGFRFSTYAVPVILGEIKRYFRDGGSLKMSRRLKELSLKAQKFCTQYEQESGFSPNVSQVAEALEISMSEASQVMCASALPLSLSYYDSEEEGRELQIAVESEEEHLTERMTLYSVLETLSTQDRELINLRYFKSKTQSDTALMLGMTQVQVSRREKKILSVLRERMT
ncbi:MAG: sigma-70 family RNA polymerase sigma factor [Ruminococcus sp.]|nr:sigma-70 family RNA polymerase sigma factor [Ruminococcus sp.]